MTANIDDLSPSGSWRSEWDARFHTVSEYREKIRELRERNKEYVREIQTLKHMIEGLQEELMLVEKHMYRSNRDE